jgi:two-component system NtrC family sensor kinase
LLQAAKLAALGQLSTGVAHEINNPTSIILTRLGLLISTADEEGLDPELIADLETLEHQTKRIAHITQSLLRFGRKSSLNSQLCSLEDIVDLTISILKHTAQKQNVLLNVEHNENATAYADSQSIEQVCFNLIKNAIESGATQVTVRTSLGHISVEDDGEGMDDETLRQVFDPFFTTKEIGEGSGLGLSVSYGIVERHGGQLKATSSPSEGTCFTVTLPTKDET